MSVKLLADAMRKVFNEAVEGAVEPLTTEKKAMRTDMRDMETRLDKKIDTINENVQTQLAQNRKDISDDVAKVLEQARGKD